MARLADRQVDTVNDGHSRQRQLIDPDSIQDRRYPLQPIGRDLAGGQVIYRQHGVRLTATKCGLQLDHRIAAFARKTFGNRTQQ